jgi:hypothetical protein
MAKEQTLRTAPFLGEPLVRLHRAARLRGVSVPVFLRDAAIAVSDDTLGKSQYHVDPWRRTDDAPCFVPPTPRGKR